MTDKKKWTEALIGRSIISADATSGVMLLSDGARLIFDRENADCCSWIRLDKMRACDNVITAVTIEDDETEERGGDYRARVVVLTEAAALTVVEAEGNVGSGYYLHGFALDVRVVSPS